MLACVHTSDQLAHAYALQCSRTAMVQLGAGLLTLAGSMGCVMCVCQGAGPEGWIRSHGWRAVRELNWRLLWTGSVLWLFLCPSLVLMGRGRACCARVNLDIVWAVWLFSCRFCLWPIRRYNQIRYYDMNSLIAIQFSNIDCIKLLRWLLQYSGEDGAEYYKKREQPVQFRAISYRLSIRYPKCPRAQS